VQRLSARADVQAQVELLQKNNGLDLASEVAGLMAAACARVCREKQSDAKTERIELTKVTRLVVSAQAYFTARLMARKFARGRRVSSLLRLRRAAAHRFGTVLGGDSSFGMAHRELDHHQRWARRSWLGRGALFMWSDCPPSALVRQIGWVEGGRISASS
jgi:hypothetical protein